MLLYTTENDIYDCNADSRVCASTIGWPDRLLGQMTENNIVWSTDDDIVWGTLGDDVPWRTWALEDIVWGANDNVVHRTDNIVWGTALGWGGVF